jgi:hypothetical protein
MFPAARIGDPITHDLVTPCGVIGPALAPPAGLVTIEFLPAAYVTCAAICTGVITGGIVHPPPPPTPPVPIVKGSLTVLVNFMPAARWTPAPDVAGCGVFLGMPPLAATRTVLVGG